MDEPIARKEYYSIGEVCDLTGLKPHVLRYWETQFDVLHPIKNRAGNRVFRRQDIELVLLVKNLLYDHKYTIEGARQKLTEMRSGGELEEERHEVLEPELLAGMKADLTELLDLLTLPDPEGGRGRTAPSSTRGAEGPAAGRASGDAGGLGPGAPPPS